MIVEEFKEYLSIPFFITSRDYKKNTNSHNIDTLFHYHKEMEILSVLDGKAKLFVNEESYEIKKDDLVVIAPYTPHRYTILADCDFKHYCMCFDLELLYDKELINDFLTGGVSVLNVISGNKRCFDYVKSAYLAKYNGQYGWEYDVIGNISLLFGILRRENIIYTINKNQKSTFVEGVVKYIASHFNEPIVSSDISELMHFNNSYFCRLFKKNFGYNFQTYLLRYRIERSKSLLKNTDMSVAEVSLSVGFNSFSYFSKVFKQYNSVSPNQYRKMKK